MKVETLADVLRWTKKKHQEMSDCLGKSVGKTEDGRARLLLDYLASHEAELGRTVAAIETTADSRALNTWCYEYVQDLPVMDPSCTNLFFYEMRTATILQTITEQHQYIIELYSRLNDQFESKPAYDLLQQLLLLEQQEVKRIVQGANRLEDV